MNFKKCDVCEKEIDWRRAVRIDYLPPSDEEDCPCWRKANGEYVAIFSNHSYDLCNDCSTKIMRFLTKHAVFKSWYEREKEHEEHNEQEQPDNQPTE